MNEKLDSREIPKLNQHTRSEQKREKQKFRVQLEEKKNVQLDPTRTPQQTQSQPLLE